MIQEKKDAFIQNVIIIMKNEKVDRFKTVVDLIEGSFTSDAANCLTKEIEIHKSNTKIVNFISEVRVNQELSFKDLSKLTNISVKKLKSIESKRDCDLKIKHLVTILSALGYVMTLNIDLNRINVTFNRVKQ